MRRLYPIAVAALCILCTACSVVRKLPEGSYLVQKVTIEDDRNVPKKERITASELDRYVWQSPNKRFLGTNFYVWVYNQSNPDKDNWWNRFKRKIGEKPVVYDPALTLKSAENLKAYMESHGFFSSRVRYHVDTTSRRKRAIITYRTEQGPPSRYGKINYEFNDKFIEKIILQDTASTLIRPGGIFNSATLDAERERITARLREQGYYNFSVSNILFRADTLTGDNRVKLRMVVRQNLTGYDDRGRPRTEDNRVYRIDRINVFPDYDPAAFRTDTALLSRLDTIHYRGLNVVSEKRPALRPAVLRQAIPLYPGYLYDASQVNRTYSDLMALGYFRSAKISFEERPQGADSADFVPFPAASPADTAARSSVREGYLTCNILCTPTLRQSFKVDLEGSTTSSFYGLKATLGYQNRNIFRGAESFDVSFTAGYEFMKAPDAKKKRATEFGITTGLTFPRFLLPWRTGRQRSVVQPRTKVELSVNFQDRPYYRRTLSSAGIAYMWSNNRYSSFSLRPVDINVVNVRDLDVSFLMVDNPDSEGEELTPNRYLLESFNTQFIGGLSFGYSYNNQRRNLNGNATNIRFNLETAGNLIDGVEHLFFSPSKSDKPYYTIFGIPYAQYFRTDLSVSRKIMLGGVTALVGHIYGGVAMAYGNSSSVPFDRQFYCGGSNGMRGWTPRTLGQGSVPDPHGSFPVQTGDVKLEANLELRFPVWGIVHGATFFDLGNVWYIRQNPSEYSDDAVFHFDRFYKQLGFNTGLGLRFDIKFAVLRLDWGIQLHNPNNPAGERWIHNFRWKNTALNFGVGYPF